MRCRVTTTGTSPASQHAQMLYDKWLLDVPKLLDLSAIYGPDNALLLHQLLKQVGLLLCQVIIHLEPCTHGSKIVVGCHLQHAVQTLKR